MMYEPGKILLQHSANDITVSLEFNGGIDRTELFQMFKQFTQAMGYYVQGELTVEEEESLEEMRLQRKINDLEDEIIMLKQGARQVAIDKAFKSLEEETDSDSEDEDSCRFSSCCNCK